MGSEVDLEQIVGLQVPRHDQITFDQVFFAGTALVLVALSIILSRPNDTVTPNIDLVNLGIPL